MEREKERGKIVSLQGLRSFAILMIMLSHTAIVRSSNGEGALAHLGGLGVELFILLSGFLTCYWHLERQQSCRSLRDSLLYAVHKLRKYYPLHIATLCLALPFAVKALLIQHSFGAWAALFLNVFLVQTWIPKASVYFSYNGVSWYLSITLFFLICSSVVLAFLSGYLDANRSI